MPLQTFHCYDAHTCGNPVRLVARGGPALHGATMSEKRLHFLKEFDWIRQGLMFEPRGHDIMSGSILYAPHDPANDSAVLFIETSGCLPMCGHGTIGTVTIAIEKKLIIPKIPGKILLETPAGLVKIDYELADAKVKSVKLRNIPSFLHSEDLAVHSKELGELRVDVAYGGNFYAIVDIQKNFKGIDYFKAEQLIAMARQLRAAINEKYEFVHPDDENICGCSHILWTGKTLEQSSTARNAVFYGEKAIDRSPCGTGTSARMAQWFAKGKLKLGDSFIHESIIGSKFIGRVEEETTVAGKAAIVPSIQGWAKIFGVNTITIDPEDDPYAFGFQVI